MALTVADRAGVKRLALTHHNARHDDAFMRVLERQAQEEMPCCFVAREGMTVAL
jgi:ribonuclease BN (tRNA processing enzyme)